MKNFLKKIFGFKKKSNKGQPKIHVGSIKVNGFYLPKEIVNRRNNDKWKEPQSKRNLENLIIENCPFEDEIECLKEMINDFTLYPVKLMEHESKSLSTWTSPEWDNERTMFFGKKDEEVYPGDIDIEKIVLFADFGHGSDTPLGLDYRENEKCPTVILLYWGENCNTDNRWKKIANSFEEFEQIIWEKE